MRNNVEFKSDRNEIHEIQSTREKYCRTKSVKDRSETIFLDIINMRLSLFYIYRTFHY